MKKRRDCQNCDVRLDEDDYEYDGWELDGQLCRMCFGELYENEERHDWHPFTREGHHATHPLSAWDRAAG